MISIKKKLSRYISISISILLVSILLITDMAVDSWIDVEFDRAMTNKANLLTTLISEDSDEVHGIEFDFADEFMPEFSGNNDPEYFQLWLENKVFERSKTLELFDVNDLAKTTVKLNQSTIIDITLPDGRSGRMYFTKFKPQIDTNDRENDIVDTLNVTQNQKTMELAYAVSNEGLNQILWFVDIIFILTSLAAVFAVRLIVFKVVDRGLKPIEQLNNELQKINLNTEISAINTTNLPEELIVIANGINHFIRENKNLYSREKRITSDIAHELKTPIAELLNLSEVAIKFPHEKQLSDNFKVDVLNITERLRNIVNSILLLQKSTNSTKLAKQKIELKRLINSVIKIENKANRTINFALDKSCECIQANEFALTTILSNLLNNALFYSPDKTPITISVLPYSESEQVIIKLTNVSEHHFSEQELALFFDPLWQKDASRTSTDRYGLGLAIVKSYCENISANLHVAMSAENEITFTLIL